VPVAERPNNMQINKPVEKLLPVGLIATDMANVAVPALPAAGLVMLLGALTLVHRRQRVKVGAGL